MQKKIVTIISGVERSLGLENYLKRLSKDKYHNTIILLHSTKGEIASILEKDGLEVIWIPYSGKKDLIHAFRSLTKIIKKINPEIVHTHLFEASFIGIHAARYCGIKKRISTRHHSTLHHVYHPQAVKYDRWINSSSTHLISISETVSEVLEGLEKVNPEKISLVYHGFDLSTFNSTNLEVKSVLQRKYSISKDQITIGVISRATKWKGIEYIIEAFRQLQVQHPNLLLLLGNLVGENRAAIIGLLDTLPKNSYRILAQETEPARLYDLFDLFIHVPIDKYSEAFGQVYVEAMAAGKPCIFTPSGIGNSLCEDEKNCLVVKYKDADSIATALERLLNNSELKNKLSEEARKSVEGKFNLSEMVQRLEELYGH